jgi:ABC-type phosphate transport system substrate-binding protein
MSDTSRFLAQKKSPTQKVSITAALVLGFTATAISPSGAQTTNLRIDGSGSMAAINESLKADFETQAGNQVTLQTNGTAAGLQALSEGKVDLAAIGRPLTPAETAAGLVMIPIKREKIAMIVGANNPYDGNMNIAQFAKLFRGEIKNWSEVGRAPGAVRFVDQPDASDTRSALSNYPAFKAAPFQNGSTTVKVGDETAGAIAKSLGSDGIGYVIANQATQLPGVKIVTMHATQPTDPRYPFSQVLGYVYKKGSLTPAAQSFLGYLTQPQAQQALKAIGTPGAEVIDAKAAVASAIAAGVTASPAVSPSPTPAATAPPATAPTPATANVPTPVAEVGGVANNPPAAPRNGWLWWLLLPIGGAIAWWALKGRDRSADTDRSVENVATRPAVPPPPTGAAPLVDRAEPIATPTPPVTEAPPSLRAIPPFGSAVTPPEPPAMPTPPTPSASEIPTFQPGTPPQQLNLPGLATGAAIGAALAGAAAVSPESTPSDDIAPGQLDLPIAGNISVDSSDATNDATTIPPVAFQPITQLPAEDAEPIVTSDLEIVASTATEDIGDVEENASPVDLDDAPRSVGSEMVAGAAAAVGVGAIAAKFFIENPNVDDTPRNAASLVNPAEPEPAAVPDPQEVNDLTQSNVEATKYDMGHSPEPTPDPREMNDLTQSNVEATKYDMGHSPEPTPDPREMNDLTQSNVEATKYDMGHPPDQNPSLSAAELATVDDGLPDLPDGYGQSQIFLMSRDPQWAYTYWDVPNEARQELRDQGGQQLALRLYDVTDIDLNHNQPHSMQQYGITEMTREYNMPIPVSDRNYMTEIGYVTTQGEWLSLARSNVMHMAPVYPSDWIDDQVVTVPWDMELKGKKFGNLTRPPQPQSDNLHDQMFQLSWPGEALRTDGSLFGSMQQIPGMSSFMFPSGMGSWALPTSSGMNQMSGVGFDTMPRLRKFWLIADAELIVYGATDPEATVTIDGQPTTLTADGTFRIQIPFHDGTPRFPIVAIAKDGEQTRQITLDFRRSTSDRHTNTKFEAQDDWF